MVGQNAGHHGLADRHRTNPNARVVTTLRYNFGVVAMDVDGAARRQNRTGGFDRESSNNVLATGNTAQDAAGVIRQEIDTAAGAGAHGADHLPAGVTEVGGH